MEQILLHIIPDLNNIYFSTKLENPYASKYMSATARRGAAVGAEGGSSRCGPTPPPPVWLILNDVGGGAAILFFLIPPKDSRRTLGLSMESII